MTKSDIINKAYSELRISGLTVSASPDDVQLALETLESMMAEYLGNYNLDIGYNFEETPNINSPTGVTLNFKNMMTTNLAVALIAAFNKEVPATLLAKSSAALSGALGASQLQRLRMVQPPRRMPIGSGNRFSGYWDRFSNPVQLPPNAAGTRYIKVGEVFNYFEDFSAWLSGNTISSFTIESDAGLSILSSANSDPRITYTVQALTTQAVAPWQFVKITVTDNTGRVDIRLISFEVSSVPSVG